MGLLERRNWLADRHEKFDALFAQMTYFLKDLFREIPGEENNDVGGFLKEGRARHDRYLCARNEVALFQWVVVYNINDVLIR